MCIRNCKVCNNLVPTIAVAVSDGFLTLSIENMNLVNRQKVCLMIVQAIPSAAGNLPVQINVNGQNMPIYNKCGNYVRADQLRTRRVYPLILGTTPPHFTICANLCPTSYVQPSIPIPTATPPASNSLMV